MPLDFPPPPPAYVQPALPAAQRGVVQAVADRWRHPAHIRRRANTGTPPDAFGTVKSKNPLRALRA